MENIGIMAIWKSRFKAILTGCGVYGEYGLTVYVHGDCIRMRMVR